MSDLTTITCFLCEGTGAQRHKHGMPWQCHNCAGTGRIFWVSGYAFPYNPEGEKRASACERNRLRSEADRLLACNCGSGQTRYPLKDGYGIFMCYVCDDCVAERRSEFRDDIFDHYDTDEPIDAD